MKCELTWEWFESSKPKKQQQWYNNGMTTDIKH